MTLRPTPIEDRSGDGDEFPRIGSCAQPHPQHAVPLVDPSLGALDPGTQSIQLPSPTRADDELPHARSPARVSRAIQLSEAFIAVLVAIQYDVDSGLEEHLPQVSHPLVGPMLGPR